MKLLFCKQGDGSTGWALISRGAVAKSSRNSLIYIYLINHSKTSKHVCENRLKMTSQNILNKGFDESALKNVLLRRRRVSTIEMNW